MERIEGFPLNKVGSVKQRARMEGDVVRCIHVWCGGRVCAVLECIYIYKCVYACVNDFFTIPYSQLCTSHLPLRSTTLHHIPHFTALTLVSIIPPPQPPMPDPPPSPSPPILTLPPTLHSTAHTLTTLSTTLHAAAASLETEIKLLAEEKLALKKELASTLALLREERERKEGMGEMRVDVCVGVRTAGAGNGNGNWNGNGRMVWKGCAGCGGGMGGFVEEGAGGVSPGGSKVGGSVAGGAAGGSIAAGTVVRSRAGSQVGSHAPGQSASQVRSLAGGQAGSHASKASGGSKKGSRVGSSFGAQG